MLNKHFTDTTKQLAKEKAQADAALADLERRRAQTKEFVPSKGGELNPYDKLYFQLQQKRAECRRKERETMLLYQRYVMKYGKSAAKSSPLKSAMASLKEDEENEQLEQHGTTMMDKTPKKTGGARKNQSSIEEEKLREQQQQLNQKKQEDNVAQVNHFMSALNKFMTDDDDNNQKKSPIKSTPSKKATTQTMKVTPSPTPSPAPEVKNFMSAVSKFMTEDEIQTANEATEMVVDVDPYAETKENVVEETNDSENVIAELAGTIEDTMPKDPPTADDGKPIIKEEEPVKMEKTVPDSSAEEPAVSPVTPDRPYKESTAVSTPTACTTPPEDGNINHTEPPSFTATTVDEEVDERSVISGLTSVNSAVTRQILDEVETEMEDFIKTETENIRRMLDSEEEQSTSNHDSFLGNSASSLVGDESVRVAMKAEAMAREMQRILDEFEEEASVAGSAVVGSTVGGDTLNEEDDGNTTSNKYPYKFRPAIPGEDWYVYYDDNYQREFYVEKKSNRTQWDYPTSTPTTRADHPITSDDFLSDIQSVASQSRASMSRRSSRRSLYRRQRRKRRTRRLLVSFFTLFCVLAAVFHWRIHYPDKTFSGAMAATLSSLKSVDVQGVASQIKDQFEYTFTDRREREEREERARLYAKAQQDRKERERAARLAREEAARKEKERAARIAREEAERQARVEAYEEEALRGAERQRIAEEEEAAKQERRSKKDKQNSKRPWSCNIPFSYMIPRCNRLAKEAPPFQETDLIFLQ